MVQKRKTPSFKDLKPASETSSRVKKAVSSKDTKPEIMLRRALWKHGLRYRLTTRHLPGKPDIVFPKEQIAIFCDGDFWHGRNWGRRQLRLAEGTNSQYWVQKIETNRKRDQRVTAELESMDWKVLRFWEGEIRENADSLALVVYRAVIERRAARD